MVVDDEGADRGIDRRGFTVKLVCPSCQIEMRALECGVAAEAMTVDGPYQLYSVDLFACPKCRREVLGGFGASPIAEHFQTEYAQMVERIAGAADGTHFRFWTNEAERSQFFRREAKE